MRKLAAVFLGIFCIAFLSFTSKKPIEDAWIRINQLGYKPGGVKVAVWGSKSQTTISNFQLVDASSGEVVFNGAAGKAFGIRIPM